MSRLAKAFAGTLIATVSLRPAWGQTNPGSILSPNIHHLCFGGTLLSLNLSALIVKNGDSHSSFRGRFQGFSETMYVSARLLIHGSSYCKHPLSVYIISDSQQSHSVRYYPHFTNEMTGLNPKLSNLPEVLGRINCRARSLSSGLTAPKALP